MEEAKKDAGAEADEKKDVNKMEKKEQKLEKEEQKEEKKAEEKKEDQKKVEKDEVNISLWDKLKRTTQLPPVFSLPPKMSNKYFDLPRPLWTSF